MIPLIPHYSEEWDAERGVWILSNGFNTDTVEDSEYLETKYELLAELETFHGK